MQLCDGFPFFIEMQWYALDCYVATLALPESGSQTDVDEGRLWRQVGRKKLKVDEVAGGDYKNQTVTTRSDNDDEDDDDDDDTEMNTDGSNQSHTRLSRCFL